MLIPIRLAPPSSPTAAAAAAANATTPAKGASDQQQPPPSSSNRQPEEWSLLELNGTLSASLAGAGSGSGNSANVGLGGLSLGQLSFAAPDKPVLVIGAHKLEGEIRKLPKPFLIMQKQGLANKRKRPGNEPVTPGGESSSKRPASGLQTPLSGGRAVTPTPNSVDSSSTNGLASPSPARHGQGEEDGSSGGTEYVVVGIVRQKLLFHNRPKPIVSKHLIR